MVLSEEISNGLISGLEAAHAELHLPQPASQAKTDEVPYFQRSDAYLLEVMAGCIFSAGFRGSVIDKYWSGIKSALRDFDPVEVAKLNPEQIAQLPGVIKHKGKLAAIIHNAKLVEQLSKEHVGFGNSLKLLYETTGFDGLLSYIRTNFKFLGSQTGPQFLKDIGFNTFKADVHVRRILHRIGLIDSESAENEKIMQVMIELERLTKTPMSRIDWLLFTYGSGTDLKYPVCTLQLPRCGECKIHQWCSYTMKNDA